MNAFNRVFSVVALIVLLVTGVLTLLAPAVITGIVAGIDLGIKSLSNNSGAESWSPAEWAIRVLFTLFWIAILAGLLWLELRKPDFRSVQVMRSTGSGRLRVSTKAITDRVRQRVDGLSGIISSTVEISAQNKAIAVRLDVLASHDTDLVLKGEEIVGAVRNVVQDELGLKLFAKPVVTMKAAPAPKNIFPQFNILNRNRKEEPAQLPPGARPMDMPVDDAIEGEVQPVRPQASQPTRPPASPFDSDIGDNTDGDDSAAPADEATPVRPSEPAKP